MLGDELGTLATFNPRAIARETSLEDLRRLMHHNGVRHLPVVDDRRAVVGMISDLDLVRHFHELLVAAGGPEGYCEAHKIEEAETVSDIMARNVVCVDQSAQPAEALSAILDRRIHSVPVVADGKLSAMVTSTDFLREFSYGELDCCAEPVSRHASTEFSELEMEATPEEAKLLINETGREAIVVTAGRRTVGVITRRELLEAEEKLDQSYSDGEFVLDFDQRVADLVPANAPFLPASATLGKAASMMVERRVKAIPVVKRNGDLAGLLEERTILAVILEAIR